MCFHWGTQNCTQVSRWGHPSAAYKWDNYFIQLAGCAVPGCTPRHGWPFWLPGHTADLFSTCHQPKPPFCRAALQTLVPQFINITNIAWSQVESLSLLLHFTELVIAQLSSLSRSLCKASLPLQDSTAPPNLLSSANSLNIHLIFVSKSFIKPLKSTGPKLEHSKGCETYWTADSPSLLERETWNFM